MLTRYCLLDLETAALPDAREWLPTIQAPGNYSKPDTISAYVEGVTMKALDRASLDPETCRIIAFGFQSNHHTAPYVQLATDEKQEREGLETIWTLVSQICPMVGYGVTWFDAGVLVRRSQLLGVPVPSAFYKQGKYRHEMIVELADYLTLNGMIEQKKGRGLEYHCRRFEIRVEDPYCGADVGPLWKDGNLGAIAAHCLCDLKRIRALAERLGVVAPRCSSVI